MRREKRDRLVAAGLTVLAVAVLLVVLMFCSLKWDAGIIREQVHAEIMEQEEEFLEPELLDLGEENAVQNDEPAPSPLGEPEIADKPVETKVVKGDNPRPAPAEEAVATSRRESPVKKTTPPATDKEEQKISSMKGKFAANNGKEDGRAGKSGSGGSGVGISGDARGRVFQGCPAPDVALRNKTVITVRVTVNEDGAVTSARATGSGDATLRRKCEQAAMKARWSAKRGAGDTRGTITFTITPKV